MSYVPKKAPLEDSISSMKSWIEDELNQIQQGIDQTNVMRLNMQYAEPIKTFEGMIVLADGTAWDPGSGQGVYCYYNSQWNKLG